MVVLNRLVEKESRRINTEDKRRETENDRNTDFYLSVCPDFVLFPKYVDSETKVELNRKTKREDISVHDILT